MGTDFLSKIIEHKKEEIARSKKLLPETELRRKAEQRKNTRPFLGALIHPGPSGVNIIAEIKRASPSKGDIRPDLDPALFAASYEKGGAAAISVLTDHDFFKGSVDDLKRARAASSLPVLRKDFLISPYQFYESSVMGADAVLLIVRVLSKNQLIDYLALCAELHLDTLVEIHSENDLQIASEAGARLIGINNRNLSSFETNIETSIRLKSMLGENQTAVAASGITSRADIEKNLSFGIYNFLIGEHVVRAENTVNFLKHLTGG